MKKDTGPLFDRWITMPRLAYVLADGGFLCGGCANNRNGSIAFAETLPV